MNFQTYLLIFIFSDNYVKGPEGQFHELHTAISQLDGYNKLEAQSTMLLIRSDMEKSLNALLNNSSGQAKLPPQASAAVSSNPLLDLVTTQSPMQDPGDPAGQPRAWSAPV